MQAPHPVRIILHHPLAFLARVLRHFQANRGTLLASAVAYHALLSLIPLLILLLVALSNILEKTWLLATLGRFLEQLVPGESDLILNQVGQFLDQRRALSWIMASTLFFFSAAAFSMLESAMAAIFAHRRVLHIRHTLISLLLPYVYVVLLGFGLLTATLLNGALQTLATGEIQLLGWHWSLGDLTVTLLYGIGFCSQVGVLTLIYMLMPAGRLPWRHALIGGIAAALLWEGVRYGLVWYFANLSTVNVIYGSLAGVIIVLITMYAISIIILLGAQVIAEYEQSLPEFSQNNPQPRI